MAPHVHDNSKMVTLCNSSRRQRLAQYPSHDLHELEMIPFGWQSETFVLRRGVVVFAGYRLEEDTIDKSGSTLL
jgi:hypothetical protein